MEKYLVHRNNVDSSQFVFRMSLISPSSSTILGRFRCFSKSRDLLTYRLGSRRNCIVSRELDRSPHKNICTKHLILPPPRYVGLASSDPDFRHYNYCAVPYFGGSDDYLWVPSNKFRSTEITSKYFQVHEKQEHVLQTIHLTADSHDGKDLEKLWRFNYSCFITITLCRLRG